MPYVTTQAMLASAQSGGYAIAAFNFENMEMAQAIVAAAEDLRSPVMLQTTPSTVRYGGLALFAAMVSRLAGEAAVPVALHLDHGDSFDLAKDAMAAGYSSVMIDGSALSLQDNILLTRRVLSVAHATVPGPVPVEAELGAIGGKEDEHKAAVLLTEPHDARAFVEACAVTSLAVAIGSCHGVYKSAPCLDLPRLKAIRQLVNTPLVLHGASGIPEDQIRACIALGVCKVNYATELRMAYTQGVREALGPEVFDPKVYGKAGRKQVYDTVCSRIRLCGCDGKA